MATRPNPVSWLRARPRLFDSLLAVVVAVLSVATQLKTPLDDGLHRANAPMIALTIVAALSLAWRRQHPLAVLIGVWSVEAIGLWGQFATSGQLASLVAAYSFGAWATPRGRRKPVGIAAVAIGVLTAVTLVGAAAVSNRSLISFAGSNLIVLGTAFLLGDNIRSRRQRFAELQERNAYLERERDLLAAKATSDERARIARELHDVVAHSVSVMAIQAGGARRVLHTKPHLAEEAIGVIETTARRTLDELRDLLGVLRTDGGNQTGTASNTPQPGLDSLDELVHADPDLAVTLTITGDHITVPAMVDLSAYRIVQEALTNVRKHAGQTSDAVSVVVSYTPSAVQVEVIDDGRGAAAQPTSAGHGLTGMRERAALCGGHLESGPKRGGGWFVRATLPVGASA